MADNGSFDNLYAPIKEEMRRRIGQINFTTYIESLVPVDIDGHSIVLQAPSKRIADYIVTGMLTDRITESVRAAGVGLTDFRLVVGGDSREVFSSSREASDQDDDAPNLNPRFTFDSFVVGKNNEFVYAAAQSVASDPAESALNMNPLFIYGGAGLGKTHLIQAIAHKITEERPGLRVIYRTCETFFNEIIDTMINHGQNARDRENRLRQKYRSADVLIIDDIQFISNKKAVQEEFFHTFNELTSKNRQIIITSDQPPEKIKDLEDRLRTRFAGGLICDMAPPNYETKIAILKRKAYEKKTVLPDDVLDFLAADSGDDVRTLEGRLTKVIFASRLHEVPITIDLAKSALSEAVREDEDKEDINAAAVINAVTDYYHVNKSELTGKSKKKEIALPRQVCCYLMCELLSLPLVSIGQQLGGRDHTTVLYSRNKVEEMMAVNERIAKDVDDIKNMIYRK